MTVNQKGRKLFLNPSSDWNRYRDGLWIESRKRVYLYWFKFLKLAELSPDHKVQWNKYREWGGKNAVMNMKFDVWWEEHWKKCFGCETRDDKPLFPLSKNHRADNLRYSLLVYQNLHRGSNWDIACHIQEQELQNRISVPLFEYATFDLNTKGNMKWGITRKRIYDEAGRYKHTYEYIDNTRGEYDPEIYENQQNKRKIQSYVGRYKRNAISCIESVCKGIL